MANAVTWKRRVAQWRSSGLTAREYSTGRGFAPATLLWWASRLRQQDGAVAVPVVPIARVERQLAGPSRRSSGIAIEVRGLRVVLDVGFDRATLGVVLSALEDNAEARS
jgi:hypothetical protein